MKAIYESHYLTDDDVANFARHSFADLAANYTEDQNASLIRYLARGVKTSDWNGILDSMVELETRELAQHLAVHLRKIPTHWVPFGHPHISIRMEAPVPIRTQCFKHKIGYVESEESRRYITSEPVFYVPEEFRAAAEDVKQGSAGKHHQSEYWKFTYTQHVQNGIRIYLQMLKDGVCPEQARFVLAQGVEVNWVWTGSLYAYAMAFNARSDTHAQLEVRELFDQVGKIIEPLYPVSWAALTRGE